jgi:hypothetical protein
MVFCNRQINGDRRKTVTAIQPRRGAFAASPQTPCSTSEQDENSLFRTLSGDKNSLFQWDRGLTTIGLRLGHPTEIAAVFGADDKMAARKIP